MGDNNSYMRVIPEEEPIYVGIDPGASGGIAYVRYPPPSSQGESKPVLLRVADMPETCEGLLAELKWSWKTSENRINWRFLLEKVWARPQDGRSSSFKFGVNYGKILMALAAVGIGGDRLQEIPPTSWMSELGIPTRGKSPSSPGKSKRSTNTHKIAETVSQFKQRLVTQAKVLYPGQKHLITLRTADAVLIAEACRRINSISFWWWYNGLDK